MTDTGQLIGWGLGLLPRLWPPGNTTWTRRRSTSIPRVASVLTLLLCATALGQNASEASPGQAVAGTTSAGPKVSWAGGQLTIVGNNVTMAEVLTQVVAVTGAKIDIPAGAGAERMPTVELGPGPAREVLASLFTGTSFDYVIQASDAESDVIGSVLLIPRQKKHGGPGTVELAQRPGRGERPRVAEPPPAEEASTMERAAPQTVAADTSAGSGTPQPPPTPEAQLAAAQPAQSMFPRPGALSPPQTLTTTSISQQLQQMYQQRMQMNQQSRQGTGTATP